MIRTIEISNYKSIDQLTLDLGRVNVFIGENGCGKTNILEAVGLAAAAAANKLDNEFLHSRGIRVTTPERMRSGFVRADASRPIEMKVAGRVTEHDKLAYIALLEHDGTPFGAWTNHVFDRLHIRQGEDENAFFIVDDPSSIPSDEVITLASKRYKNVDIRRALLTGVLEFGAKWLHLDEFLTYTPHEEALRDLARESWIEPVGIHGEGLFTLLQSLDADQLAAVKDQLALIHWFADLELLPGPTPSQHSLKIVDQYLADGLAHFDQRSANEGFLFLLLYACLLVSQHTPRFFAVDNVDTSLNPKLAAGAVRMFAELTGRHDRQVLLTTHNPGTLDGLDLADDEQRLFVVYRNLEGRTRVRRIERDPAATNPVRLSEAFLRGYLGGLPNHF